MEPANQSITGVLTHLDGEAFELADDAGNRRVFAIAIDLATEPGTLQDLHREGRRVLVEYEEETPAGPIAHHVTAAPPQARA